MKIEKPQPLDYWKSILIIGLIAGALILWPKFVPTTSTPLVFEIAGFEGDAQIYDQQTQNWRAPKRGEEFQPSQKLRTGKDGIINFKVENELQFRLKENSQLEDMESCQVGQRDTYKLLLKEGVLLGATFKQFDHKQTANRAALKVITPQSVTDIYHAIFRIQAANQTADENKIGILRGFAEVSKPIPFLKPAGVRIRGLERVQVAKGAILPAQRVTQEEWAVMKEGYELREKTAVREAEQIDLSKHAGSFFECVFDHGTFYTPQSGYAGREFFKDPETGKVILETEYDVFPAGSFVGVYTKTRNFDLSKYRGFSLEVRRRPEEGTPDSFMIEIKSKGNVVRRYAPRGFERNWKTMTFDFYAKTETPVSEIVFVFMNDRAGEAKKGILEFRDIDLIPLPSRTILPKADEGKAALLQSAKAVQLPEVEKAVLAETSPSSETSSRIPVPKEIPLE